MSLSIIVAYNAQRGIGYRNQLPWHLSEDLIRFKAITTGHIVVMGRKTFESIGKPLPHRRNIVLTQQTDFTAHGVEIYHDLKEVLHTIQDEDAFIIGGAHIYKQALPFCSQILATEIQQNTPCDAFFPALDRTWQETTRSTFFSEKNQCEYAFVTYQKKHLSKTNE